MKDPTRGWGTGRWVDLGRRGTAVGGEVVCRVRLGGVPRHYEQRRAA
jgi:hypothetical protein